MHLYLNSSYLFQELHFRAETGKAKDCKQFNYPVHVHSGVSEITFKVEINRTIIDLITYD